MSDASPLAPVAARPRRRWPRRLAAGFILLNLVLTGVGIWLVGTEAGSRFLFARLGALVPGSLTVTKLTGPLRGPLAVDGLVYRTDTIEVHVAHLDLDWRLAKLLERQLDITRLDARGVEIRSTPAATETPAALPDVHLPVNIIVRHAQIRDLQLTSTVGGEPTRIDDIALATSTRGDLVTIERLAVRGPGLEVDVSGSLRPQGAYDLDLQVAWSALLPDLPKLAGSATLTGTLARLVVGQDLTLPVVARIDAVVDEPLRAPVFDGTVSFSDLDPHQLAATAPVARLTGKIAARGTLDVLTATLDVAVLESEYGPFRVAGGLARDGARWSVAPLNVRVPGTPANVGIQGSVTVPATPPIGGRAPVGLDLTARWTDVSWPLRGRPSVGSQSGEGHLTGTVDAYHLEAGAAVTAAPLPPGRWQLTGDGDRTSIVLTRLDGNPLRGTVTGHGRVAWEPEPSWDLTLAGSDLDPAGVVAGWPGRLTFDSHTAGRVSAGLTRGEVGPLHASGSLRGQPVTADGTLRFAGNLYTLDNVRVDWGGASVIAHGTAGDRYDLAYQLSVPNLTLVVPGAAGSLTADGTLRGPAEAPRVIAAIRGTGMRQGTLAARQLTVDADVDLARNGTIRLDVAAADITLGERHVATATLVGRGSRGDHRVAVVLVGPEERLSIAVAGALDPANRWRGQLVQLDLHSPDAGDWALAGPADLDVAPSATASPTGSNAALRNFCWTSADARLCADGRWTPADWHLAANLTALPLTLFAPFLPDGVGVTGTLGGTVEASQNAGKAFLADVALRAPGGQIRYPGPDGKPTTVAFEEGTLSIDADGRGLQSTAALALPSRGRIDAALTLPNYVPGAIAATQELRGHLTAEVSDIGFFQAFLPGLSAARGRLAADLSLAGTRAQPAISGRVALADAGATIPSLGITLREVALTAEPSADGRELAISGQAKSGKGELTLAGRAALAAGQAPTLQLTVKGRQLEVMDTREVTVEVAPSLELAYAADGLTATGDVAISFARIEIEKQKPGVVLASADVVVVGREAVPATSTLPLHARVRVVMGKDVRVKALGFDGRPQGSLLITEEPGRVTTAVGEITISEGTYKAYGQDLAISRGRLVFAGGPVDDPGLDVRAARTARDGTVAGVEVRGTLKSPQLSVWSEPPMAQADQLSYLLLGRPLAQATTSEGGDLANAAIGLGLKGGNLLAKKLAARFGLEEARIESDGPVEEASLVLGKYLSPRLYVAYGVGLFDPVSTFRIRYLLSRRWTLEAETGVGTSADVLYTLERGGGTKRDAPDDKEGGTPRPVPESGGERSP